ncbi:MAG: transposase [Halioglobus sp.]|nr:transposase [Halioglobus sp.]
MSRPLRIEFEGALYHVTARGNELKPLYRDSSDRIRFLRTMERCCERYQWLCHAYCLMGNHYHLVVETPLGNLSRGVAYLNSGYSQYFNKAHSRVGHLFQGRYKSILVEKQSYLLELSRYVVLNPVRAGMVLAPEEWPWSSYRGTAGLNAPAPFLDSDWILGNFSDNPHRARQRYRDFVMQGLDLPAPWGQLKQQVYLGSSQFVEQALRNVSDDRGFSEVPKLQCSGVPHPISHYRDMYRDEDVAIALAYLSGNYTLTEVGEFFGKARSTVSRKVRAYEESGKRET